jgi:CHASE3 domain sensor protein
MDELLKALVQQAFQSQNERIEALTEEIRELKADKDAQAEKIKNLEELNGLFDNKVQELIGYIKTYVGKDDEEISLMEEYKFGEQDRK